ncbi:MAG: response regulator [candidate division Zixibacteria bacterium]|nr:response regulator [candidate division Zixibacteria bacterium]
MKALVILDNNRAIKLEDILSDYGYSITEAISTKQAIKILESDYRIDLVIISNSVLEHAQTDLIKYLKSSVRLKWIPIILVCEKCSSAEVKLRVSQGVNDIITFPFDKNNIAQKLNKIKTSGKRIILIVDDEPEILKILRNAFEIERFKVITASSAEQALEILRENKVHAVVSDILLPGITGIDLLVEVKQQFEHIPVILITGYAGQFSPDHAMSAGADGYFKKPFKNLELVRTLRQVLQNYQQCKDGENLIEKKPVK